MADNICPLCLSGTLQPSTDLGDLTLVCSTCGEIVPYVHQPLTEAEKAVYYSIQNGINNE